jgi:hypothetical protein
MVAGYISNERGRFERCTMSGVKDKTRPGAHEIICERKKQLGPVSSPPATPYNYVVRTRMRTVQRLGLILVGPSGSIR